MGLVCLNPHHLFRQNHPHRRPGSELRRIIPLTNSPKLHRGILHISHGDTQLDSTQNLSVTSKPCKSSKRKGEKEKTRYCENVEYKNREIQQTYLDREEIIEQVSYDDNESESSKQEDERPRLNVRTNNTSIKVRSKPIVRGYKETSI